MYSNLLNYFLLNVVVYTYIYLNLKSMSFLLIMFLHILEKFISNNENYPIFLIVFLYNIMVVFLLLEN